MATIYNHITGGGTGDNCIILESKERLIYPFNIGDYSEVRWGMIFSWAPPTGNNGQVFTDTTSAISANTQAYLGLCNYNTGIWRFPGQSNGFDFIGCGGDSNLVGLLVGSQIDYRGGSSSFNVMAFNVSSQTGRIAAPNNNFGEWMTLNPASGIYGETKFSAMAGQRVMFNGNTYGFGVFHNKEASNNTSDHYLQTGISALPNYQGGNAFTGFWTSGGNSSTPQMIKPNSIFIYNPMSNRMRIHNIMVERYA